VVAKIRSWGIKKSENGKFVDHDIYLSVRQCRESDFIGKDGFWPINENFDMDMEKNYHLLKCIDSPIEI